MLTLKFCVFDHGDGMTFQYPDTMPPLSLNVPKQTGISGIELNESLLHHWIKQLPENNLESFIELYLVALQRFNTNQLDQKQRLRLLDIYRQPLNQLVFRLSPQKLRERIPAPNRRNAVISSLTQLMSELATGYKVVIVEANQTHSNLKLAPIAQLAINRACEQLSYIVLHAYKFYRTPLGRVFHDVHQLYQLTLTSSVEKIIPIVESNLRATVSFKDLYSQLMLVCICNPYGLHSGKVLDAYKLMAKLAPEADISPLPPTTKATSGHFYINCLSDRIPTPSILPMTENQTQPPALIFNTKPILSLVDTLFQQAKKADTPEVDINLLKQITPFLNTSYERKQVRVPITGNKWAYLAYGIEAVHTSLMHSDPLPNDTDSNWEILNKNRSGYLISQTLSESSPVNSISIGDFIGIFEPNPTGKKPLSRVGFVRWMRIDKHDNIKMGLSLIEGDAVSIQYTIDDDPISKSGLFFPEIQRIQQAASLITEKGDFVPNAKVTIIPKKKRFTFSMAVAHLLSQGNNYQHFTLKESSKNAVE